MCIRHYFKTVFSLLVKTVAVVTLLLIFVISQVSDVKATTYIELTEDDCDTDWIGNDLVITANADLDCSGNPNTHALYISGNNNIVNLDGFTVKGPAAFSGFAEIAVIL